MLNKGTKPSKGRVVKRININRVVIAIVLALIGLGLYLAAYQYTYQAKLEQRLNKVQSDLDIKNKNLQKTTTDKANLQKQVEDLNKAKSDLESQLQAKRAEQLRIASLGVKTTQAVSVAVTGDKATWMAQAGIPASDWGYVDYIVSHEGGWNGTTKYNYGGSGAYGLCQALPGSKMASAGADWATNPVTQLKWCNAYAAKYGGWAGSYNFWINNHWW